MIVDEQDIDFLKLSDREFEELCFDLLLELQFSALIWRQGGADGGRDIEGTRTISDELVGAYEQKWFCECKRHEKGVPIGKIHSKIAWADAEKPAHLVIITTSYLTDGCRRWLEKAKVDKPYAIHVVEGKQLKRILLGFPGLVVKYCLDQYHRLLHDVRRNWLIHDLIPAPEVLCTLLKNIANKRLATDELAFLWCAAVTRSSEIDDWASDNEAIDIDPLFARLADLTNTSSPLISEEEDITVEEYSAGTGKGFRDDYASARVIVDASTKPRRALYCFVEDDTGQGLEVLLVASGGFPTRIRHVKSGAKEQGNRAIHVLIWAKHRSIPSTFPTTSHGQPAE